MKDAVRTYKEYIKRVAEAGGMYMTLVLCETSDWTDNFAIIMTRETTPSGHIIEEYDLYYIDLRDPKPLRTFDTLKEAQTAFFALRYNSATYTEYPF